LDVSPKNVLAAVHGPLELVLASMRTLTVMLLTDEPMRQSECTAPLALLSACVVASSTTAPVPLNVSVARKNTVPKSVIVVEPVYWMKFAPSVDQEKISEPVGFVVPSLFIFSPYGTVPAGTLLFLMPMYRLEKAPAVPVHVHVAPPASFSLPATAPPQFQLPPGEYVGPAVMTIAAAGDAATSSARTARVAMVLGAEPLCLILRGRADMGTPPFRLRCALRPRFSVRDAHQDPCEPWLPWLP
jgi:hypothetical protein